MFEERLRMIPQLLPELIDLMLLTIRDVFRSVQGSHAGTAGESSADGGGAGSVSKLETQLSETQPQGDPLPDQALGGEEAQGENFLWNDSYFDSWFHGVNEPYSAWNANDPVDQGGQ